MTAGLLYAADAREYGRLGGLASALGLLTMPRVFAHAHFAAYDGPLLCLWFLTAYAFFRASAASRFFAPSRVSRSS